jgi:FtsP/CotA-like multicopper oxidase with cupredoxin domain
MSRNQRIGLIAAALAVAVIAFVIAGSGGDDEGEQAAQTTPAETEARATETEPAETQPTETQPAPPPKPKVTRIQIRGGQVAGGAKEIEATTGETVRILVAADVADEIHLHGYDITENAAPGRPARFLFKAKLEGVFELESHVAEDAGRDPLVARLLVEPS